MKKANLKRLFAVVLFAVLMLTSLPVSAEQLEAERTVVILHTNDMHGSLIGSSSVIGADLIAALKQSENALLVDAGDAAQGVALASQSKGEDVIKIMNAAGYDAMALGNHEFDYGLAQLAKLKDMAEFPMLSANTYLDGKPLCAKEDSDGQRVILEKNGVKVGIFALTTQSTATATKPENLAGVEFKDEIETAKEQVEALDQEGADVIIALTHMGVLEDSVQITSKALAEAMSGTELDAIIDGHSHTLYNEKVGEIVIAQTGTGSVGVGKMEIALKSDGSVEITETMLDPAWFAENEIQPDPAVTQVITAVSAELNQTLAREIGETKTTLWGGSIRNVIAESRAGETNFGSLICDAMIADAEKIVPDAYRNQDGTVSVPVVAIENGGGFRSSVPNGKMTAGQIVNALPFANTIRIKEITPAVLYELLEGFISSVTAQDVETGFLTASYSGSFPQIGGMRMLYDPNRPKGEKITHLFLLDGNTELKRDDAETKLILVSNDYVIEQGVLAEIPMIAEGSGLTEAVFDYLNVFTKDGTEPLDVPVTLGRIVTDGAYRPGAAEYTAHIQLTGADSLTDGERISFYMDGNLYQKAGIVRDGGILDVTLPDGPHAVKLYPEQQEVYVNNYSGNGILNVYGDLTLGYPELAYNPERTAVPFTDMTPDDWFYSAVQSLWEAGLVTGITDSTFGPDEPLTRGMFVTMLGRMEPETDQASGKTSETGFSDVDGTAYYAPYVAWGSQNGILFGFDADTFKPDAPITREQAVTILWRYEAYKGGADAAADTDIDISSYADAAAVSEYAVPALQWACGAGLVKGSPEGTLEPQRNITRAEAAVLLERMIKR